METLTKEQQKASDFIRGKGLDLQLKWNGYIPLLDAFNEYSESQQSKIEELERENEGLKENWYQDYLNTVKENTKLKQSLSETLNDLEKLNNRVNEAENIEKCKTCNGDGYYSDHNPDDPHVMGECEMCPIEVECSNCKTKGFVKKGSQETTTDLEESDLPF